MNSGRFQKGLIPHNKGKKNWWDNKSRFQKGNITWNHRTLSEERIDSEGYAYIKVAEPNKWRLKHRVIYERHYGEIPNGSIIRFYDNDKLNLDIANLFCVTRRENALLNKLKFAAEPIELKPVILAMVQLIVKTKILSE
jgi:hypothetical protein